MPDRASGFCVYNDVAVGIQWLLDQGAQRVAYVDVDVHHGDGVEAIFWDDPRVLTISLHESGQFLFPGTGFADDTGGPGAEGSAVNVALPPGTADAGWLRAFHAVVPPLLREFDPEILVTQHGCDSHADDPLAHLMLSVDGQRAAYLALHDLAHEVAGGRWVATGGGGYALVDVVPRAWTHLLAIVGRRARSTRRPRSRRRGGRTSGSGSAARRRGGLTDGGAPAYRDWSRGLRPGRLAGPERARRPGRRSSRCTGSTRCPELGRLVTGGDSVAEVTARDSALSSVKPTRRRPLEFRFVNLFPTSHIRPYSHGGGTGSLSVGKPMTCAQRKSVRHGWSRGHRRT